MLTPCFPRLGTPSARRVAPPRLLPFLPPPSAELLGGPSESGEPEPLAELEAQPVLPQGGGCRLPPPRLTVVAAGTPSHLQSPEELAATARDAPETVAIDDQYSAPPPYDEPPLVLAATIEEIVEPDPPIASAPSWGIRVAPPKLLPYLPPAAPSVLEGEDAEEPEPLTALEDTPVKPDDVGGGVRCPPPRLLAAATPSAVREAEEEMVREAAEEADGGAAGPMEVPLAGPINSTRRELFIQPLDTPLEEAPLQRGPLGESGGGVRVKPPHLLPFVPPEPPETLCEADGTDDMPTAASSHQFTGNRELFLSAVAPPLAALEESRVERSGGGVRLPPPHLLPMAGSAPWRPAIVHDDEDDDLSVPKEAYDELCIPKDGYDDLSVPKDAVVTVEDQYSALPQDDEPLQLLTATTEEVPFSQSVTEKDMTALDQPIAMTSFGVRVHPPRLMPLIPPAAPGLLGSGEEEEAPEPEPLAPLEEVPTAPSGGGARLPPPKLLPIATPDAVREEEEMAAAEVEVAQTLTAATAASAASGPVNAARRELFASMVEVGQLESSNEPLEETPLQSGPSGSSGGARVKPPNLMPLVPPDPPETLFDPSEEAGSEVFAETAETLSALEEQPTTPAGGGARLPPPPLLPLASAAAPWRAAEMPLETVAGSRGAAAGAPLIEVIAVDAQVEARDYMSAIVEQITPADEEITLAARTAITPAGARDASSSVRDIEAERERLVAEAQQLQHQAARLVASELEQLFMPEEPLESAPVAEGANGGFGVRLAPPSLMPLAPPEPSHHAADGETDDVWVASTLEELPTAPSGGGARVCPPALLPLAAASAPWVPAEFPEETAEGRAAASKGATLDEIVAVDNAFSAPPDLFDEDTVPLLLSAVSEEVLATVLPEAVLPQAAAPEEAMRAAPEPPPALKAAQSRKELTSERDRLVREAEELRARAAKLVMADRLQAALAAAPRLEAILQVEPPLDEEPISAGFDGGFGVRVPVPPLTPYLPEPPAEVLGGSGDADDEVPSLSSLEAAEVVEEGGGARVKPPELRSVAVVGNLPTYPADAEAEEAAERYYFPPPRPTADDETDEDSGAADESLPGDPSFIDPSALGASAELVAAIQAMEAEGAQAESFEAPLETTSSGVRVPPPKLSVIGAIPEWAAKSGADDTELSAGPDATEAILPSDMALIGGAEDELPEVIPASAALVATEASELGLVRVPPPVLPPVRMVVVDSPTGFQDNAIAPTTYIQSDSSPPPPLHHGVSTAAAEAIQKLESEREKLMAEANELRALAAQMEEEEAEMELEEAMFAQETGGTDADVLQSAEGPYETLATAEPPPTEATGPLLSGWDGGGGVRIAPLLLYLRPEPEDQPTLASMESASPSTEPPSGRVDELPVAAGSVPPAPKRSDTLSSLEQQVQNVTAVRYFSRSLVRRTSSRSQPATSPIFVRKQSSSSSAPEHPPHHHEIQSMSAVRAFSRTLIRRSSSRKQQATSPKRSLGIGAQELHEVTLKVAGLEDGWHGGGGLRVRPLKLEDSQPAAFQTVAKSFRLLVTPSSPRLVSAPPSPPMSDDDGDGDRGFESAARIRTPASLQLLGSSFHSHSTTIGTAGERAIVPFMRQGQPPSRALAPSPPPSPPYSPPASPSGFARHPQLRSLGSASSADVATLLREAVEESEITDRLALSEGQTLHMPITLRLTLMMEYRRRSSDWQTADDRVYDAMLSFAGELKARYAAALRREGSWGMLLGLTKRPKLQAILAFQRMGGRLPAGSLSPPKPVSDGVAAPTDDAVPDASTPKASRSSAAHGTEIPAAAPSDAMASESERDAVWGTLELCVEGVESDMPILQPMLRQQTRIGQRQLVDERRVATQEEHDRIEVRWLPALTKRSGAAKIAAANGEDDKDGKDGKAAVGEMPEVPKGAAERKKRPWSAKVAPSLSPARAKQAPDTAMVLPTPTVSAAAAPTPLNLPSAPISWPKVPSSPEAAAPGALFSGVRSSARIAPEAPADAPMPYADAESAEGLPAGEVLNSALRGARKSSRVMPY